MKLAPTAVPRLAAVLLLPLSLAPAARGDAPQASAPATLPAAAYEQTPQAFEASEPAGRVLDRAAVDQALLAVAIFQETNRERLAHGLPPLRHDARLDAAALAHAQYMADANTLAHEEPDAARHSPLDRERLQGISPTYVAENVATAFALQYQSRQPYYKIPDASGRLVPALDPHGPPIPPHTYGSFARALLDEWMHSPGHRANILSPEVRALGTAAVPAKSGDTMPMFYGVQDFAAP